MDTRVSIEKSDSPILFLAPHGADDTNTAELTELLCNMCNANGVINWGWERSSQVDVFNDKANCNSLKHLNEDVVKDEFLNPITKRVNYLSAINQDIFIFIIHGVGNDIRKKTNDPKLDLILGYGRGNPPAYTCSISMKNSLINKLSAVKLNTYVGRKGGKFSGRSSNNLNQLFQPTPYVHSVQIEVVYDLRKSKKAIEDTALKMSAAITAVSTEKVGSFKDKLKVPSC